MAFKPVIANTARHPFVTILAGKRDSRSLTLSALTHRAIGEPRAVAFEWDEESSLLRISAAAPEHEGASKVPPKLGHGVSVTSLLRQLGVHVQQTTRIPVTRDGPLAVIADLAEYRSTA